VTVTLSPYDLSRIALEQVGAVVGALNARDDVCEAERGALLEALECLEELADRLEPRAKPLEARPS
jgi:hypothetical protein